MLDSQHKEDCVYNLQTIVRSRGILHTQLGSLGFLWSHWEQVKGFVPLWDLGMFVQELSCGGGAWGEMEGGVCSVDCDPAAKNPDQSECRTQGPEGCGDCFRREGRGRAERVGDSLHIFIAPLPTF